MSVVLYVTATVKTLVQTMTLVLVPVARRFTVLNQPEAMAEMLVRGTRYSSLIGFAVLAVTAPVMGPLLGLWLKPEMAWLGTYAVIVGFFGALSMPLDCAQQILNGMGDSRRPFWAVLAGGVISLAIVAAGLGPLHWGFGAVVVGISAGFVIMWLAMTAFALRSIRVNLPRYAWEGYGQAILIALPAAAVGAGLGHVIPIASWPRLIGVCAASGLVYCAAFLPVATAEERRMVRSALARVRQRIGLS
jgi:O-antigen/teichoic acid export membrane protein